MNSHCRLGRPRVANLLLIRCVIVLTAHLSLSRCIAEPPQAYVIVPKAAAGTVHVVVGKRTYHGIEVPLSDYMKSASTVSHNNSNSQYSIVITTRRDIPSKGFTSLVLKGKNFAVESSGRSIFGDRLSRLYFSLDSKTAALVAEALGVPLQKRADPKYQLHSEFSFRKTEKGGNAILKLTNLGDKTVVFRDGGMNRGMRSNQFYFKGTRDGKPLRDIGSSIHFGGLSFDVTLNKGEVFEKETNLGNWVDLSQKGKYEVLGSFLLECHENIRKPHVLWRETVSAKFKFEIE